MTKQLTALDIEQKIKLLESGEWQARSIGCFEIAVVAQDGVRVLRREDVTHYWYYRSISPRGNRTRLQEEQRKFERGPIPTLNAGSTSRSRTDVE